MPVSSLSIHDYPEDINGLNGESPGLVPDGTCFRFLGENIVLFGPEDVHEVCPSREARSPRQRPHPKAQLLVIAAPRPFGLPDLERIQAGQTEGRFFVEGPSLQLTTPSPEPFPHPGWMPEVWMHYAYRLPQTTRNK